jgi:pantoate--beta-alanine ligase
MTPAMRVLSSPDEASALFDHERSRAKRIGFVPTMGALHEGHLALVRHARETCDTVCVSIFVNPTQFGPNEDLARYPRDLDGDLARLEGLADVVFTPSDREMYPPGEETRVRVGALATHLCGPFRPGHFEGVCTVVAKLFAIVGPSSAVFGRKDYQQLTILKRMTTDLILPIRIVGCPIVREADGLAMSSRNRYLSPEDRDRALGLSRGLRAAANAFASGERRAETLRGLANAEIQRSADRVDYVEIADPDTLAPLDPGTRVGPRALVAIACHIGKTRLIDNTVLGEDAISSGA